MSDSETVKHNPSKSRSYLSDYFAGLLSLRLKQASSDFNSQASWIRQTKAFVKVSTPPFLIMQWFLFSHHGDYNTALMFFGIFVLYSDEVAIAWLGYRTSKREKK